MKVLITYASKYGSTTEIAKRVFKILNDKHHLVDFKEADEVTDITAYGAVILGSAVYIGQWRKAAVKFLKTFQADLSQKKVWLFSTGPTGEGNPEELMKGWKFPENLQSVADEIKPGDIKLFHGALDDNKLNKLEKLTIKMVKAPLGDFRDWKFVEQWAENISNSLSSDKMA